MQLPKPSIQEACDALRDRDEYRAIVQYLRDERDRFFSDLRMCSDANDVMKVAGSIAALDEIVALLS
jgi:histidinol-phosphate/aromatic aminotransferase/cobyric acid decarboxylase-like protein